MCSNIIFTYYLDLKVIFDAYDKNGDGKFTLEEVEEVFREQNRDTSNAARLIELTDTDKSGGVELGEFIEYMAKLTLGYFNKVFSTYNKGGTIR